MPPTYNYAAADCPALAVPSTVLDPAGGNPLVATKFELGMDSSIAVTVMQELAVRTDLSGRWGGGIPAVLTGLELSDGGGLLVVVGTGQAMIDGAVTLDVADDAALANNVQNHIWLGQAGAITVTTGLLAPAGIYAYLGSVTTAAGAITEIDASGVVRLLGGIPIRRTADALMPADTPPATTRLFTYAPSGLWLWDGTQYWCVSPAPGAAASTPILDAGMPATGHAAILSNPLDGRTLQIDVTPPGGALDSVVYEFDDDASVAPGNVAVTIGATEPDTAANLRAAIFANQATALFSAVHATDTAYVDLATVDAGATLVLTSSHPAEVEAQDNADELAPDTRMDVFTQRTVTAAEVTRGRAVVITGLSTIDRFDWHVTGGPYDGTVSESGGQVEFANDGINDLAAGYVITVDARGR